MILEDIKGTKKYIGDIGGTMVENFKYFFKPWMSLRVIGKHNRKMLGDIEKGSIFLLLGQQGLPKRTSRWQGCQVGHQETLGAKKVNVFSS